MILAQYVAAGSFASAVIWCILVAAIIGIALVAIHASGVRIPGWVMQIGWIVLVAIVAILAIKFLMGWA